MRNIKFRAWDKDFEMMGTITEINWRDDTCGFSWIEDGKELSISKRWLQDYELMQYIGLKDKNGKEIYEGDILKFEGNGCCIKSGELIVALLHEPFCEANSVGEYEYYHKRCEVVGNIHEHPKLLEGIK